MSKSALCLLASAIAAIACAAPARAQQQSGAAPTLGCEEIEQFLRTAQVGTFRDIPKGVTMPHRATLDDGKMQHDAAIQTVDVSKPIFQSTRGTEMGFRDYWGYNVAGYELAKLLGLNMVPPYVARKVHGSSASLSWWVKTMMDEGDRQQKKLEPPDLGSWNQEMWAIRVFNQLIYNTDDNLTNFLITPDWHLWMVDFSRAFRTQKTLRNPENLTHADRGMLEKMRELNKPKLKEKLGAYLRNSEIDGLLTRRDIIVRFFDDKVAREGEAAVLYDLPRSAEPCGTGL
jgi:hypothetical protein